MTAQVKDNCKYLGNDYKMPSCLSINVTDSQIVELSHSELENIDTNGVYLSTACWRNYIATWEIRNNQLLLIQLEGKYQIKGEQPLIAYWFTGEFELPQGELVDCDLELGFQLKYTKAVTLRFVAGKLVESIVRDVN